jgi:predicted metal-binding protein
MYKKTIFILLLFTIIISSCRSKKQSKCPSFETEETENKKVEKKSKYKVVILKDGKRLRKKRKKSKNRLFK